MSTFSKNASDIPADIFQKPERLVRPDWAGHIPFHFLLLRLFSPRLYVELGVFHGDSYCAACQAVKTHNLPTRLVGIDCWQGDIHTGIYGEQILRDLRQHHHPRYAAFSTLEQGFFDQKLDLFKDGEINLLHIDGEHTYKAVRRDFESWLPKVSKNGIVLFHDTDVFDRADFGVWQFWDELMKTYPGFRFNHCNGLGVLSVGPVAELPESIQWLFTMNEEEEAAVKRLLSSVGEQYVESATRMIYNPPPNLRRSLVEATLERE